MLIIVALGLKMDGSDFVLYVYIKYTIVYFTYTIVLMYT